MNWTNTVFDLVTEMSLQKHQRILTFCSIHHTNMTHHSEDLEYGE